MAKDRTNELAIRIYEALKVKGADIGNASVPIIEAELSRFADDTRQAAAQDAYTWRHLDESKPPDDTVCLVTDEGLQPCVARYIASANYFVGQFRGYNPQWWLPIPAREAAEAGKEG